MTKEKRKYKVIRVPDDAETRTLFATKVRPNDPCPCGSGKKAKKCCGTETAFRFQKHLRTVVKEADLMKNVNIAKKMQTLNRNFIETQFCYIIGQQLVVNDKFPDETMRDKIAVVTDRGLDSDAYNPYYKIDVDGIDATKWVAEYCLSPLVGSEEGGEK